MQIFPRLVRQAHSQCRSAILVTSNTVTVSAGSSDVGSDVSTNVEANPISSTAANSALSRYTFRLPTHHNDLIRSCSTDSTTPTTITASALSRYTFQLPTLYNDLIRSCSTDFTTPTIITASTLSRYRIRSATLHDDLICLRSSVELEIDSSSSTSSSTTSRTSSKEVGQYVYYEIHQSIEPNFSLHSVTVFKLYAYNPNRPSFSNFSPTYIPH